MAKNIGRQNKSTAQARKRLGELQSSVEDLQTLLDQVEGLLTRAYYVSASRKELAEAVGKALLLIAPDDWRDSPKPHDGEPDEDD